MDELSKIYSTDLIDKQVLLANIRELLQDKTQVSLQEVVASKGITKGLAELLAYITLINTSSKFLVNENIKETILFDTAKEKYLEVPQIIFTK
jgi:hypothetical protein